MPVATAPAVVTTRALSGDGPGRKQPQQRRTRRHVSPPSPTQHKSRTNATAPELAHDAAAKPRSAATAPTAPSTAAPSTAVPRSSSPPAVQNVSRDFVQGLIADAITPPTSPDGKRSASPQLAPEPEPEPEPEPDVVVKRQRQHKGGRGRKGKHLPPVQRGPPLGGLAVPLASGAQEPSAGSLAASTLTVPPSVSLSGGEGSSTGLWPSFDVSSFGDAPQLSELQLGALSELVTSGSSLGETGKSRKKRPAKKVSAAEVARMQAHTAQNLMRRAPSLSFLKVLSATERQMYLRPLTPSGA